MLVLHRYGTTLELHSSKLDYFQKWIRLVSDRRTDLCQVFRFALSQIAPNLSIIKFING